MFKNIFALNNFKNIASVTHFPLKRSGLESLGMKVTLASTPYLSAGLLATLLATGVCLTLEVKAWAQPEQSVESGKTTRETMLIDKKERQYFLHVPVSYNPAKATPVMLVFNGWSNKPGQGHTKAGAEGTEQFSGLSEKADQENFIVVYMDGYQKKERSWNNGQWFFSKQDDMKFTNNVLDSLKKNFNIDSDRVYLAGYSQGASFAHRFATTYPEKVAGLASVGGWLTGKEHQPTSQFSLIEVHADGDPTVPADGRAWWLTMKPQKELKDFYRTADGMTGAPQVLVRDAADGTKITEEVSKNKATGAEFRYITIQYPGHKWFGGKGAENAPLNATDTIWDFLKNKRKIASK